MTDISWSLTILQNGLKFNHVDKNKFIGAAMIKFEMMAQPDDESCGLSCLFAIYRHYGIDINYDDLVNEVERSLSGGTLAPLLGKHALKMGFKVTLYPNNLTLFDPSWFNHDKASASYLEDKLLQQLEYKKNRFLGATHIMIDYLHLGGIVNFHTINIALIESFFDRHIPVIAALNSTYLYNTRRERFDAEGNAISDDIGGTPCGHFVVLYGHEKNEQLITVADPYSKNPIMSNAHYYKVPPDRLINAIMLGLATYDGNLLIIEPKIQGVSSVTFSEAKFV